MILNVTFSCFLLLLQFETHIKISGLQKDYKTRKHSSRMCTAIRRMSRGVCPGGGGQRGVTKGVCATRVFVTRDQGGVQPLDPEAHPQTHCL